MISRRIAQVSAFWLVAICGLTEAQTGKQESPNPLDRVPAVLLPADPELLVLVREAASFSQEGHYDAAHAKLQRAFDVSKAKKSVEDIAKVEGNFANAESTIGRLDSAQKLNAEALGLAKQTDNVALRGELLVEESHLIRALGRNKDAEAILIQAVEAGRASKEFYVLAYALGELGGTRITMGDLKGGVPQLDEALQIEAVNRYPFRPLHTFYRALATASTDLANARKEMELACELAKQEENYVAVDLISTTLAAFLAETKDLPGAKQIVENVRTGKIPGLSAIAQERAKAALDLPAVRAGFLNISSTIMGYSGDLAAENKLQLELFQYAKSHGMTAVVAGSAYKLAENYRAASDLEQANSLYSEAARAWMDLGELGQADLSLLRQGDMLLRAKRAADARPVAEALVTNGRKIKDDELIVVGWKGLAQTYWIEKDWDNEQKALKEAETVYLSNPTKINLHDALSIYTLLAANDTNRKKFYENFLDSEKALVLAAHLGDQQVLDFTVPLVAEEMKALKIEEDSKVQIEKHNPLQVLYDEELLAAYEVNAPKWTKFKDTVRPAREHYARIFQLGQILLDKGASEKDFDDLYKFFGPVHGSIQAPLLGGFISHFSASDHRRAEEFAITAIEGPWGNFNVDPWMRAWLTCSAGYMALLAQDQERVHKQVEPCSQAVTGLDDQQLVSMATYLRASDVRASPESQAESWKIVASSQPSEAYPHNALGWSAYNTNRYDDAIKEWETELSLSADSASKAQAHIRISWALDARNGVGDRQRASGDLAEAHRIYAAAKDKKGLANVTLAMAEHAGRVDDKKAARKLTDTALELAKELDDPELLGELSADSAALRNADGDYEGARRDREESAGQYEKANNVDRQAVELRLLAADLRDTHHDDQVQATLVKALSIANKVGRPETRYWIHRDFARLLNSQGEFDDGLQHIQTSLRISREMGNRHYELWALESLAIALEEIGDWDRVISYANDAEALAKELALPKEQVDIHEIFISAYGSRRSLIRNFPRALQHYQEAQQLISKINDPAYRPVFWSLPEVYLQSKRFDEGIAEELKVIKNCSHDKAISCEAEAWMSLAELYRKKGDLTRAREALNKAAPLAKKDPDFFTSGYLLYAEAGQEFAEGNCEKSTALYQQVVGYIEKLRSSSGSEHKKSLGESYSFVFDELQEAMYCASRKQPSEAGEIAWSALRYAESNKAASFTRDWGQVFLREIKKDIPAELAERERTVTLKRDQLREELLGAQSGVQGRTIAEVSSELTKAQTDLEAVIAKLRSDHPKYAAIKYPQPVEPKNISMQPGEMLVDLKVTDSATFVWILGNRGRGTELIHYYRIDKSRDWFETKIGGIRETFNSGAPGDLHLADLEELLTALFPASTQNFVFGAKHLIVLPDGPFYLLPFEILRTPTGTYPLAAIGTTYVPSATALTYARSNTARMSWPQAYFGLGDPVSELEDLQSDKSTATFPPQPLSRSLTKADLDTRGFSLQRLPGTVAEIEKIAAIFRDGHLSTEVRLAESATKDRFLVTELSRFQFLHLATHGFVPTGGGLREPSLIFSYKGSDPEKMLLSISEIVNLKLNSDMVTLSACNTGSGRISRAEGVMNLGRAFLMAGSKTVTVSLWSVSDESTSLLMQEYYRQLTAGKTKPEALASARSLIRKNPKYENPYYWGPFVLIGD